jgi:hypothetical protein
MNSYIEDDQKIILEEAADKKRIRYHQYDPTISSLYENFKDGDLILSPDFQRKYIWDKKKASNLIESIVLNIPLPLIFTTETHEGEEEVVDGQQRLTTIFSFIDGKFPDGKSFKLSRNLKILGEELGGKSYKDLNKNYQKTIKKSTLPVIRITSDSHEDIKFEMFERLNTNIMSLKAQELRNCLYRGVYNEFLKRMAEYPDFQFIINKPNFQRRYSDVELVLMFCAFYHKTPEHYNTNIKQMLNIEMRKYQNAEDEKLDELELQFKKSVRLVKHIFGQTAFNIYEIDENSKNGRFKAAFNYGLYQIIMYWFIGYKEHQVIQYSDLIREEMINLMAHDFEFLNTLIGSGTNSLTKLRKKFDVWGATLKGVIGYPESEPRAFSYALKKQLYENNPTCKICSQKIITIDDAEVDHIVCYWKGGKTVPENARLAHRLCNRMRGGDMKANTI